MKTIHQNNQHFTVKYERQIQALVYFGAAFLVIIVGLRGLGDLSTVSFIPSFVLNSEGKIDSNIVMLGLLVEFTMLCLLAASIYFNRTEQKESLQDSIDKLSDNIEKLANGIPEEIGVRILDSVQNAALAAERLIAKESDILTAFKKKIESRLAELDQDIISIRENISSSVVESTLTITALAEKEKSVLDDYHKLVGKLVDRINSKFDEITSVLRANVEGSTAHTEKVFRRNQQLIEEFHNVNKEAIFKVSDELRNFLKEHAELIKGESDRLKWAAANQLRPEEFMANLIDTNKKLLQVMISADDKLYRISEEIRISNNSGSNHKSVYGTLILKAKKLFKNKSAESNGKK
ncbi:MAG: hypothetical protein Kow0098_22480 [Ignavibacteriaceae bacterium]